MKLISIVLLSVLVVFFACTENQISPIEMPTTTSEACPLDGQYVGIMIWERTHSINGGVASSSDTIALDFSIDCQDFARGNCTGSVDVMDDTIFFESGECGCWCDCNPYVDCGGDLLLGSKTFTFDGDSLLMWRAGGNIDSLSIPGVLLGYWHKVDYFLKKQ